MHPRYSIDIVYFNIPGDTTGFIWDIGSVYELRADVSEIVSFIENYKSSNDGTAILFWDFNLGLPDAEVIQSLNLNTVDAWHAGIKLGLGRLPDVLNYVEPVWMYNCNASEDIEHTSFRLSIRAALVKVSVLKSLQLSNDYNSIEMFGVSLGYSILKTGAIIRYHPLLVPKGGDGLKTIPNDDEWVFARQFFSLKWQVWSLLNRPGFVTNFLSWIKTSNVHQRSIRPSIHTSKKIKQGYTGVTVSVLIPTLNRYSYLVNELDQLSLQNFLPLEVLITDQTDEIERDVIDVSKYPDLNIRYFPQNEKGQCIAWNKLLEEAKGEFVLFLGDDADDISKDFLEHLIITQQRFDCDVVAANVIEAGIEYIDKAKYYHLSDTLPIALVRKSILIKAGFFDMFFNKNIRADQDLALRCHLHGALMIFDPSVTIFHHRAPVGGLRTHNARVHTTSSVKKSISGFLNPTPSELYIARKYFTPQQAKAYIRIKYLNQVFIKGNLIKKATRLLLFIYKLPSFYKAYKKNNSVAVAELNNNALVKMNYKVPTF